MNTERIEHLFRELTYHIGEGRLSESVENIIINIEEQYRALDSISERQEALLERLLREVNER